MDEIYQEHSKTVYNYMLYLCKDDALAEDLTQETFYIATKKIDEFRNECKIEVWLCQIGKNLWYSERKRNKNEVLLSMDSEIGEIKSDYDLETELIAKEEMIDLYKHMKKLDEPTRELIHLRLTTGLTFKDIAQIMDKTEAWAQVNFYRGKERLKEMYEKEDKSDETK